MNSIVKTAFLAVALVSVCSCNDSDDIVFGTTIEAKKQMKESERLAATVCLTELHNIHNGCDMRYCYHFPQAGVDVPFRVCTPAAWNGVDKLPLVMFLHGGWNDENSYLDQDDRLLIRLADEHGYLLVSPLGCNSSYGNRLVLPAEFGRDDEAEKILGETSEDRMREQELSEKDIINVLEIVKARYPVDEGNMFLCGHSMGSAGTWYLGAKYSSYWKALAMLSGPFVLKEGYPWKTLKRMPIFVSEGTLATASLRSSRELAEYAGEIGLDFEYKEVDADHPGMVPLILPDVFDYFDRHKGN